MASHEIQRVVDRLVSLLDDEYLSKYFWEDPSPFGFRMSRSQSTASC